MSQTPASCIGDLLSSVFNIFCLIHPFGENLMWQLALFQNLTIYYCKIFQILTFFHSSCTSSKKWTHQRDPPLGEVENEVGTDDEVTSTAKSPAEAKELFAKTEQFAKLRYKGYKKLSEGK